MRKTRAAAKARHRFGRRVERSTRGAAKKSVSASQAGETLAGEESFIQRERSLQRPLLDLNVSSDKVTEID